jgi:hypothetical protein
MEKMLTKKILMLTILAIAVLAFNQYQISSVRGLLTSPSFSGGDLGSIDVLELKSTAHTIQAVFPLADAKNQDDVMAMMFPTGTPDYGEALGVTFDDPVTSLKTLSEMYQGLKTEVEAKDPESFQRFIKLASNPAGVSCEYCCGIGPVGADKNGQSRCGCDHNPGILSLALYLSAYTDYSDGEILREAMKWKTLWFPKNMIELGMQLSTGDSSALENLPGMVGGC